MAPQHPIGFAASWGRWELPPFLAGQWSGTYTTAMISMLIEPIMPRSREPNIPQVDCVLHAHAEFERAHQLFAMRG
jgi:hypothetical protein